MWYGHIPGKCFRRFLFDFNVAASMPGSVDLPAMFQVVSRWLHGMGTSQVSHFVFLCLIDADVLDLERYRYNLHPAVSTPGSNDPIGSFWVVSAWLHDSTASQVSISVHFHPINVSRYNFDSTALTPGSNDPICTYGVSLGWLRKSGTSVVSDFVFSRLIDANALNLESSIFTPRLPWHPVYEGKYLHPSDSLSRSP